MVPGLACCSSVDDLGKSRAMIEIRAWIRNYLHGFRWYAITHSCPNSNYSLVKLPLKFGHA